ncbi:MAG: hypothetical protein QXG49_03100, partial [Candidatus Bathyarchaeia archaeon]
MLFQTVSFETFNKPVKCRIMDFYVDFCGNISPQTLCEYSLLSQPYTFTGIAYVKVSVDGPP